MVTKIYIKEQFALYNVSLESYIIELKSDTARLLGEDYLVFIVSIIMEQGNLDFTE